MSLDFTLYSTVVPLPVERSGIFVREDGRTIEISRAEWDRRYPGREPVVFRPTSEPSESGRYEVFSANITHNLAPMAKACGLWEPLWRPYENGYLRARDMIGPLTDGLARLQTDPDEMRKLNPENGWGDYDALLEFTRSVLVACQVHHDAEVEAHV